MEDAPQVRLTIGAVAARLGVPVGTVRSLPADLPEEPSPEQVAAWLEPARLVADDGFAARRPAGRRRLRHLPVHPAARLPLR